MHHFTYSCFITLNFTQSIELFDIITDFDEPFQHLHLFLQKKSIQNHLKSIEKTIENHNTLL
jgi:hypothetical protein